MNNNFHNNFFKDKFFQDFENDFQKMTKKNQQQSKGFATIKKTITDKNGTR